ncbi:MAG: G-D-S-L family lipolytic protein [Ignavibacteriales bacterium]|nr:G-D-S-L family lipolytic protein [Ignavibacteriales bacterium]
MLKYFFILLVLFTGCTPKESTMEFSQRIVFFGDSITELGLKPNGYVSIVRDSLKSFGSNAEIIGAGISGNKVTDLQQRLEKDVLAKKPSIVVVYIGINDVWHFQFVDRGLTGTSKEEFKTILTGIVATIQSTGATVILCTPSVVGEKKDGTNDLDPMLDEYSEISRTVARERNTVLLDLRKEFLTYLTAHNPSNAEKNILTYDGVHLNDAGNKFVAGLMIGALDGLGIFFPNK